MQAGKGDSIVGARVQDEEYAAGSQPTVDVQSQCSLEVTKGQTTSKQEEIESKAADIEALNVDHRDKLADSASTDKEQHRAPRSEPNSSVHTGEPPSEPADTPVLSNKTQVPPASEMEESQSRRQEDDSVIPRVSPRTHLDDDRRILSTSTLAPSNGCSVDSEHSITSAPHSTRSQPLSTGETSCPALKSMTSKPPRPTSVPIVTNNSASMRRSRDGTEYPRYPDQSFAALQPQHCPPLNQPYPLKTRSSHASQNSSSSSIPSRGSRDHIPMVTGAKTVGNTPAQSPGLFSPVYPASRNQMEESEDSQTSTPLLHPAHMQTPKETHKLRKEVDPVSGQKQVNNYQLHRKLGSGQHGTVKLGQNMDTKEWIAMKIVRRYPRKRRLRRTEDPSEMIKREIAILKKARHPHVVSLLEVIDDERYQKVYLVLEFVELGEIVWRKKTDKDVAIFEMNRIKRELEGNVNEDFEKAEVENFNSTAVASRSEKAVALAKRKQLPEQGVQADDFGRPTSAASESPFWSLEHGGEPEDDQDRYSMSGGDSGLNITNDFAYDDTSLATSIHDPLPDEPPETPKPTVTAHQDMFSQGSKPNSAPPSPANLAGTMYGPYMAEEQKTDNILQNFLHQLVTEENDWSAEEQEYMHVPCLTISQALDVFRDTVLGLEFLHYQGIIHRDIKPANLLWTRDHRVKISDFGVSYLGKPIRPEANNDDISEPDAADLDEAIELAKTVGTPAFYAPELCDPDIFMVDNKTRRPPITGQIDVWALGVTLYCMIFGRLPFHDTHEFTMYEKIAKEELFIPRQRLKAVEDKPKPQMNSNKRFDDIVEYEDVDDELRDLLKRLLNKDPSKRISIKEVKHHPWLLRGIQNQPAWIDETDPNLQSEGRKIEISDQDVQEAFVAAVTVTFVDKVKNTFGRMGSVLRGRNRKRAESEAKGPENAGSAKPPKVNSEAPEGRRTSLRGDEQIYTALWASRENSEHPLTQSVTASPELKTDEDYFDDANTLMMASKRSSPHSKRPSLPDRSVSAISTTESMKTVRAVVPPVIREDSPPPSGSLSTTTTIVDTSSPSGLGGIFGGGGRRRLFPVRSRERGRTRDSPSAGSSRSSSVSIEPLAPTFEDPHSSPSLAFSTAVAAGHVDPPPALRDDVASSTPPPISRPPLPHHSSSEAFQRAQELNDRRQILEYSQAFHPSQTRHRTTSLAANIACPPSPDDDFFPTIERSDSALPADENPPFGISSSSDQMASNISESFSHPSIPSIVSGASSLSGTIEPSGYPLEKTASPSTIVPERDDAINDRLDEDPAELTPKEDDPKAATEEDEAGYNGEEELDSDSDDGGLVMGGQSKKPKAHNPSTTTI
ncbi:MAG: hypothetical protein Q9181_001480 [Wetmoreana brouardii]